MLPKKYFYPFLLCWLTVCANVKGQTVIGMGTDDPNPNAVLELVAEHQNQGFLVPRLTTQQRNASSFTSKLTGKDNGLLVFDIDEGNFYYWYDGAWRIGSGAGNQVAKGTVWYAGETMPDNNQGEDRDFYIHQSTGDLYRKQDGAFVIIGNLKKTDQLQLANKGNGQILLGDGTQVNARAISGDMSLANTGAATVTGLQGKPVETTAPTTNDVLIWNGSAWIPSDGRSSHEIRWFSSNVNPQSSNFSGGKPGDLFYKYDENRYWRRTGTNPGDWEEIVGPSSIAENGKRMNGQLNTGTAPSLADRKPGMLWLDEGGNGSIKRWTGTSWEILLYGD